MENDLLFFLRIIQGLRFYSAGDFWPPETRKVMGLMGKSKAFAINIVGNPVWQKVGQHFLTSVLEDYYVSFASL